MHHCDQSTGLDHLATASSPEDFWNTVKQQIQFLPKNDNRQFHITKVLLAGESATNPTFLKTLGDALFEVTTPSTEGLYTRMGDHMISNSTLDDVFAEKVVDPLFAAARGAALYARWRQEAPYECIEKKECSQKREEERKGAERSRIELR